LLTRELTPGLGWVVGMLFAFLDVVTTWYALMVLHLQEGNPAGLWAIERFGLSRALALRILVGAVVLGAIAWGATAPLPRHREFANRACRWLLVGSVALWGTVALSNATQIAYVRFA
jgi:hypothetical protein